MAKDDYIAETWHLCCSQGQIVDHSGIASDKRQY